MVELVMYVGLAGAGKSSYKLDEDIKKFSSGELRHELYGDENDQTHNGELFNELRRRIIRCLKDGESACLDATNLSAKRRRQFLKQLAGIECMKTCIVFAAPVDVCVQNDAARERHVGAAAIMQQLQRFELPDYSEGWDFIKIHRYEDKSKFVDLDFLLEFFKDEPHDNPWHKESITEHMLRAEHLMIKANAPDWVRDAARYHDVGKFFVKRFDESRGYYRFFNHQNVSVYLYLTSVQFKGRNTAWLIQHHMDYCVKDAETYKKWAEDCPYAFVYWLEEFHKIDELAAEREE